MSLNPSNAIAARTNPGKTMFPNLAYGGRNPDAYFGKDRYLESKLKEIDWQCASELSLAEIQAICDFETFRTISNGQYREVPTKILGSLHNWTFRRAWYYWAAEGPGIPPQYAMELHKTHGTQVRVAGHCGCPSPIEWYKGFAVGDYHVDTQEGLIALADTIRRIIADAK
ncbi:MAG TPA: hypothetical protein VNX68_16070 [Nitrosopumilaceae archaeon]|jgi:hypothetical protein|nr:hypothetical protein [Nitrosopumilaceae archaeon]